MFIRHTHQTEIIQRLNCSWDRLIRLLVPINKYKGIEIYTYDLLRFFILTRGGLVFRYNGSYLLCESSKTSLVTVIVQYIPIRPTKPTNQQHFCPNLTNQQLPHRFTPGHRSTDAAPGQDCASLIWQRLTQRRCRQRRLNLAGRRRRRSW